MCVSLVSISSDPSLEKHVSGICSTCFYWLHQITVFDDPGHRVHNDTCTASRVDYYITMLAGSPRFITDRLRRVLNAAARVITGTWKFDHGLSDLLHSELHWQCVQYKLGVTIYRCLQKCAPQYLVDCCVHMSDVSSRQRLWSANWHQLFVS